MTPREVLALCREKDAKAVDSKSHQSILGLIPDAGQRSLTQKYRVPVRRGYHLAKLPIPSATLLLIDPMLDYGLEIPGVVNRQAVVSAEVWTLVDGETVVGGVCVGFPQPKHQGVMERKIRSLGRVDIISGVIAISDRDAWRTRPPETRGDELRARIEENGLGEISIDASSIATSILLPTGYGAGKFAAVATFQADRIVDVHIFMLKGNSP